MGFVSLLMSLAPGPDLEGSRTVASSTPVRLSIPLTEAPGRPALCGVWIWLEGKRSEIETETESHTGAGRDSRRRSRAGDRASVRDRCGQGIGQGVRTMTHDYKRHGTTTLFAALNVLTGKVIGQGMPRHRHQEWSKFLKTIDREVPKDLAIHLICDNYATHKHQDVA